MEPTIPGVHLLQLAELLERWQVAPAELFAGTGLTEESLAAPRARVSIPDADRLVARAIELSGEPGLGFPLGLQMRIGTHGEVGLAAMTASTLRDALAIATRFAPTRTNALELRLKEEAGIASLFIDERAAFGASRVTLITALVVGIWQIGNALTGKELVGDAEFRFPEPAYFSRFAPLSPGAVRFGEPVNRIVFDAKYLELPIVMADRSAQRVAREQLERALDSLGKEATLIPRVRALIAGKAAGSEALEDAAKQLGMSDRTLKRRLGELGTSFSDLADERRRDEALQLVRTPGLSIEEIALKLGYSDAANFTRAFRRWTGRSPRAYRRDGSTSS